MEITRNIEEVVFPSETGVLYGTLLGRGEDLGVVLCPPHPLYGGSRFDHRLAAVALELEKNGITALTFDYRNKFARGRGEIQDAISALRYLRGRVKKIGIFGYSFGAVVASNAASKFEVIGIAYLAILKQTEDIQAIVNQRAPKFFIHGKKDQIAPYARFEELYQSANEPKQCLILENEDHFFHHSIEEIAKAIARFFKGGFE
ncbi:MAG: dienelactone hydrolase family protein [Methanocellales archaeon]